MHILSCLSCYLSNNSHEEEIEQRASNHCDVCISLQHLSFVAETTMHAVNLSNLLRD